MIKKVMLGFGCFAAAGAALFILYKTPFIFGKWNNEVIKEVGTEYKDIKREQFEHSKSYVEGMIKDLQKIKREYDQTEDNTERKALMIYVQDQFSNFNEEYIENDNLREFLKKSRELNIK